MTTEFNSLERRILERLVQSYYRPTDRRFTLEELTKKVNEGLKKDKKLSAKAVERKLDQLESYLSSVHGIDVKREKSPVHDQDTYCIFPNDLKACGFDELLHTPKKDTVLLYLAEVGFGTKALDPRSLVGLRYLLENNKLGSITGSSGRKKDQSLLHSLDAVLVSGGVMPFVPDFYSARYKEYMHLLSKEANHLDKAALDKIVDDLADKTYDELTGRMTESGHVLPSDFKEFYDKHIKGNIRSRAEAAKTANHWLTYMLQGTRIPVHAQWGDEDHENFKQIFEAKMNRSKKRRLNYDAQLKKLYKKLESATKSLEQYRDEPVAVAVEETVTQGGMEMKRQLQSQVEALEQEIKSIHEKQEADKVAKDAGSFSYITKHQTLDSAVAAALHHVTKHHYNEYYDLVGQGINLLRYPEGKKDIRINGWSVRLEHNPNVNSNAPTSTGIEKLALEANREKRLEDLSPDVIISGHSLGGFEYRPQAKAKEESVVGKYRETPEQQMLVQLPTLHSQRHLELLRRNNMTRNWAVKRFDSKNPFASGAVLHYLSEAGDHKVVYLENEELIALSYKGDRIKQIDEALGGKVAKAQREKLQQERESLVNDFQLGSIADKAQTTLISMHTDQHLGSNTRLGRPTNVSVYDAVMDRHRATRMPDHLIITEPIHGNMKKPFASALSGDYIEPCRIEKAREAIRSAKVSDAERLRLSETLHDLCESIRVQPQIELQVALFDSVTRSFIKDTIKDGGKLYFCSGNHTNKSTSGDIDEAALLGLLYRDEPVGAVTLFPGYGADTGNGQFQLNDGRRVSVFHRLPGTGKSLMGMKRHAVKSNSEATLTMAGDTHHPALGYADHGIQLVGPGMQAYTPYCDEVGMQPSLRGSANVYLSNNPRFKKSFIGEFILDQTLERQPEFAERIMLEKQVLKFLYPEVYK